MGHQHVSVREGMVLEKRIHPRSVREQAGNRFGLGLQPMAPYTVSRRGGIEGGEERKDYHTQITLFLQSSHL